MISNKLLIERLAKHIHCPCEIKPGTWLTGTNPVTFFLMVDDFGVKYVGKEYVT